MIFHKSDENCFEETVSLLKNGKIAILPTDTVYGFSGIVDKDSGCDSRIRKIKGREETKPMIQLISSAEDLFKYTSDKIPTELLSYWPGPLTIIVNDLRTGKTTAFRCPGDKWLRDLIKAVGKPLYSTSVNRSGFPVLQKEKDIVSEFEKEADVIVLDGDTENGLPSTIVGIENGNVKIIRQGCLEIRL